MVIFCNDKFNKYKSHWNIDVYSTTLFNNSHR